MEIVGQRGVPVRAAGSTPTGRFTLENALAWMNDPEITATLKLNLGFSRRQEELFFQIDPNCARSGDFVWAIVDEQSRHIGFIGLHEINWRNRWATGGLLIGDRSAWGKGYATDAVRVRTRFAFGELGLRISESRRPHDQPGQ